MTPRRGSGHRYGQLLTRVGVNPSRAGTPVRGTLTVELIAGAVRSSAVAGGVYASRQFGENFPRARNWPRPARASDLRSVTMTSPREIVAHGHPVISNPSNGS